MLPSFLLRQVNLQVFSSAADLMQARRATAAGASVELQVKSWAVPLGVRYQATRRLSYDDAWSHIVVVGTWLP